MKIEEAIKYLQDNLNEWKEKRPAYGNSEIVDEVDNDYNAIETLLTAYEKEKEKNKRLEKFIKNGEHTWKQKYNETFEYFKQELKEKEVENKRLRKCHLQYEEMTGIDLLLPKKEE